MYCPSCGRPLPSGNAFCGTCGARVEPGAVGTGTVAITRPTAVSLLAILHFISSGILGFVLLVVLLIGTAGARSNDFGSFGLPELLVVGFILVPVTIVNVATGVGLWKLKPYGRTLEIVLSIVGLIGFPIGTIISVVILVYMFRPEVKIIFSGRAVNELTADEAAILRAEGSKSSSVVIVIAGVLVALAAVAVVGIVAAIAIPGLLRARMAGNEATAIGAMRAVNSAQQSFDAQCRGYAPSLIVLGQAGFLPADLSASNIVVRSGYSISMRSARSASGAGGQSHSVCDEAVSDYFAAAEPTSDTMGTRSFATTSEGTIYQARGSSINQALIESGVARPLE